MAQDIKSPFLEGFEDYQILRPSVAYHQARASYPVRISELVFGSLLASYILGFVSVGANQLTWGKMERLDLISDAVVYMTICCSFSFLTAALYTVYHNSILTMPNVPISDLTTDFLIAISQAIFFGISIVWPDTFLFCLALLLLLVFFRQETKFRALARYFYKKLDVQDGTGPAGDGVRDKPKSKTKPLYVGFRDKIKQQQLLHGWGPVVFGHYASAVTLLILGVLAIAVPGWLSKSPLEFVKSVDAKNVRAIIYLGFGVVFFTRTKKILQSKSVALDDYGQQIIEKMDSAASDLARAIKN